MKITNTKTFFVEGVKYNWTLLKIESRLERPEGVRSIRHHVTMSLLMDIPERKGFGHCRNAQPKLLNPPRFRRCIPTKCLMHN